MLPWCTVRAARRAPRTAPVRGAAKAQECDFCRRTRAAALRILPICASRTRHDASYVLRPLGRGRVGCGMAMAEGTARVPIHRNRYPRFIATWNRLLPSYRTLPMSRFALPIAATKLPSPWPHGLGFLVAAGSFSQEPGDGDVDAGDACSILTVLIDLGKQARKHQAADRLLPSVNGVQAHGWQRRSTWPGSLLQTLLGEHPSSTLNLILRLPERGELDARAVDALIEEIRALALHAVGLVAAVAASPADWSDLRQVPSFVRADAPRSAATAAGLFEVFAALMAPVAQVELDGHELARFLGPSSEPSFLIDATWSSGTGLRVIGSSATRLVAGGAAASLATPICADPRAASVRALHHTLVEQRLYGDVALSVTSGLFLGSPEGEQDAWPVRILCRPV